MEHEVRLIRPEPFFGRLKPSANGLGKWLGYIDKFFALSLSIEASSELGRYSTYLRPL